MSFPDNPELLRTRRNCATRVINGELDDDEVSAQLSNLLGFAKNFYLQFFDFEFDLEIRGLHRRARKAVRPVERKLRASKRSRPTLRLISRFVTLVEFLEEDAGTLYDHSTTADRRRRILEDINDLLDRIAVWAATREDLPRLSKRARDVADDFVNAVEIVDIELGYDDEERDEGG